VTPTRLSLVFALLALPLGALAQTPPAAKLSCSIEQPTPPTDASRAFNKRNYSEAESLYRAAASAASAEPDFAAATAGLVRSLIDENKSHEAVDTANAALKLHPTNAVLLDALGEAYYRRGETDQAAVTWNAAGKADPCNAHVHLDMARFFHFNAEYASEQRQLEVAHQLAPHNKAIPRPYSATAHTETKEEMIDRLTDRLDSSELSPDAKASLQRTINVLQAQSRGTCEVTNPKPTSQIPIVPIANGPTDMYAAGLEVTLNGKKKRFELDTGASGLLLSRSVARAAGLISEAESQGGGIGDQGPTTELLAHVDDIKIGDLDFHNCLVRIFDKKDVLPVDGLIGADVFSSYLVTIDVPSRMVRLAPLPPRPDDTAATSQTLDTSGADAQNESAPRNRYVAPEMATWTKVFRSGHMLIFPTNINKGPWRLFLMDTGASYEGLISIDAAKEVTGVRGSDIVIRGVSGKVNDVHSADDITIYFGGVGQQLHGVPAVDLSAVGRSSGVEISGLIGFVTLRELIISIDYRDSLVHVVYDPKHGFHAH